MDALIESRHITVTLQGNTILKDVSLTINPRDFMTIIGPNGAGKSILLKCLMGITKPNLGEIRRKKALKIGYIPQCFITQNSLPITVEGFLRLRIKTEPSTLNTIIHEINIADILKRSLAVLSGGELQRVLLARSLLNQPELIVLDEPVKNLDIAGQLAFYKLLNNIYKNRNISILMVSHDLHMVMASTKQVVCLFHHICCSGTPEMVTQTPEFISLFGHDMADMMAIYQHRHHAHQCEGEHHV